MRKVYVMETNKNLIIDGYAINIKEFAQQVEKIAKNEGNALLDLDEEEFENAPIANSGEWYFTWNKAPRLNYYCVCVVK